MWPHDPIDFTNSTALLFMTPRTGTQISTTKDSSLFSFWGLGGSNCQSFWSSTWWSSELSIFRWSNNGWITRESLAFAAVHFVCVTSKFRRFDWMNTPGQLMVFDCINHSTASFRLTSIDSRAFVLPTLAFVSSKVFSQLNWLGCRCSERLNRVDE